MDKKELRNWMKEKKLSISTEYLNNESQIIMDKLRNHPAYKKADVIYTYVSFNQEVRTHDFIKSAFLDKKVIAVPKVAGDEIVFMYIDTLKVLEESKLGILEPDTLQIAKPDTPYYSKALEKEYQLNSILVVVPGLAFDINKNRMGYGKGYYDRFFHKYSHIPMTKIAPTFDFQVLEQIAVSNTDVKMDEIITQSRDIT